MQVLVNQGHVVTLICWRHDTPEEPIKPNEWSAVSALVTGLHVYRLRGGLTGALLRLLALPSMPSHVASRLLRLRERIALHAALRETGTDLIWTEGPYPAHEAMLAAKTLGVGYVYRSHNIEHQYMAKQAHAASGWKSKLTLALAVLGLRRFEMKAMRAAKAVMDISNDDMAFWRQQGIERLYWLPPVTEGSLRPVAPGALAGEAEVDVVFLGNLTTPNNVQGVSWLMREVYPRVQALRPGTTFLVAGSNPVPEITELFAGSEWQHAQLLVNPPDALSVFRRARVLVNPVQVGSGIQMKAIEMLSYPVPVVTAVQGTCGMPEHIKRLFVVVEHANDFARAIVEGLAMPLAQSALEQRLDMVAKHFGGAAVTASLAQAGVL